MIATRRRASGPMVYVPQDINVQFGPTEEHPGGRVVHLRQGYLELNDELAAHPVLSRLVEGTLPGDAARRQRLLEAEQTRDEAVAKVMAEYNEEVASILADEQEERQAAAEDFAARRDEARERGESFNEPHPDPEVRRAHALTAPIAAVPAGALVQKPQGLEGAQKTREALPTKGEQTQRQQERKEAVKSDKV